MKKVRMWMLFVLLLSVLVGCSTSQSITTKPVKTFAASMQAKHHQIDQLQVEMASRSIEFNYTMKQKVEDAEVQAIFQKTRELILSPDFQKDAIEGSYFEMYSKKDRMYPQMIVRFDFDGNGEFDCMYESSYYQTSDLSTEEMRNLVDGYKTWTYWDYKNDPVPIP